jgi:hypothetical protein
MDSVAEVAERPRTPRTNRGRSGGLGALLVAACAVASSAADGAETVATEPFPQYDRNTPEGARAVLEWLERATAPGADGKRRCVGSNLLVLIRSFPRTDPIDEVFREYLARGGVAGAAAVYRLGEFARRVDLLTADDPCVREFVTPLLIREVAQVAEADGRTATARTTSALRRAVAAHDGKPHEFDDARPALLWGNFAVLASTCEGKGLQHLLHKQGDGWEHLGAQLLWGG